MTTGSLMEEDPFCQKRDARIKKETGLSAS